MQKLLIALASINPVAFRIGPFAAHWYGIGYIIGIVAGVWVAYLVAKRWEIPLTFDDMLTIALCVSIGIFVGGRVGYCLFYGGSYYWTHPLRILAVYDGGMSFHGGFVGCALSSLIATRFVKVSPLRLVDLGSITAPIGLGLVRLANYINGELWGRVTTVPWGVVFANAGSLPRHPSQLYEALLEGAVLFITLLTIALLHRRPPREGLLFGWFLILYGTFRIGVEFFREPDVSIGFIAGNWLTMGMLLSLPMVVCGMAVLIGSKRRTEPRSPAPERGTERRKDKGNAPRASKRK